MSSSTSRRRTNNVNLTAAKPLARSSSLFGTLKSIVSVPLSWFDSSSVGTGSKRRRVPELPPASSSPLPDEDGEGNDVDDEGNRSKRMRIDSPERERPPQFAQGYLDPPSTAFPPSAAVSRPTSTSHDRLASLTLRRSAGPPARTRRTHSPLPRASASGLGRTMSMDPPSARASPYRQIGLTRDVTMHALTPDPAPAPFRMRTSLTPQPSLQKLPREPSEPPPLAALMSAPTFVRAPSESAVSVSGVRRSLSVQPTQPTLGALVDAQRRTRSPARTLFGTSQSMSDISAAPATIPNAAERALYELDVYKTPLLPTRLRGSSAIPDMFRPPAPVRAVVLNARRDEKDKDKGRSKGRREREVNGGKPYAGEGGMKKLLARRRMEEREERKEKAVTRREEKEEDADRMEEEERAPITEVVKPAPAPVPAPVFLPPPPPASSSSLRVGRTRTRPRSAAPSAARSARGRFSAVYNEDDEDEAGNEERERERKELEEAAKRVPAFEVPVGFSFAKEAPAPPTSEQELSTAKEPPIPSLPFSLSKSATPTPAPSVTSAPLAPPEVPAPTPIIGAPPPAPLPAPVISLVPPTPEQQPPKPSSIPNFFASSAVLADSKPALPTQDAENPFWEGNKDKGKEVTTEEKIETEGRAGASKSLFGAVTATPSSMFGGAPAPAKAPESAALPSFFNAPKQAESTAIAGPSFSFAAPPKPAELAPKPESKQAEESSKPPSLFGSVSNTSSVTPSFSGFSQPAPTGSTTEAAKPPPSFSFGQTVSSPPPTEPAAPKPLFGAPSTGGGFSFGHPPGSTSAPSSSTGEKEPPKSPFSFGAPPSTPPGGTDKKPSPAPAFNFGAPAPAPTAASGNGFSFSGNNASGDMSSKPFSFGAPTSAPERPVTPPKNDQEFRMEESPTRDMQLNGTKDTPKISTSGFSFNTSNAGASSGGSLFGGSGGSGGFSFGGTSSNPFGPKIDTKVEEKPSGFGSTFAQPPTPSSSFSFGQPKAPDPTQARPATAGPFSFGNSKPEEPQRPSSSGSFSFGQPAAATSAPSGSSFSFGAPSPSTTNVNPFSQASQSAGSAPNSPSTFAQSAPFSFPASTPTTAPSNPFAFGASQPASPAGASSTLPQQTPTTPSSAGGAFSFSGGQATSPFSTSASGPPPGGTLFTIGAAPTPAPMSGNRQIKKLPSRRPGAKR